MTHSILSARTDFSIGESILTVEELVGQAVKLGAKAVGITDTMSVTAMIDFTNRCKSADIKPLIGCRLRIVDDPACPRRCQGLRRSRTRPNII